jgi:peptidoglycan/xylan/chitin deacetylase (PgdA/CDA1 family)
MTVAITGDVHHLAMATRDQSYLDGTEVGAAIEYAEIAAEYDLPVTLFCTGKCIDETPEDMQTLAEMSNVELGGHNYWAFTTAVHTIWRAVGKLTGGRIGSWNGPRRFQAHEIDRTLDAFDRIGVRLACWRDHAYRHDCHTAGLLADRGITHFSDAVEPGGAVRRESGLTVVPINTPPDHEHVYHAFRTRDSAAVEDFEGPFGSDCVPPNSWREWVLEHVRSHQAAGETATILAHPACMRLADGFDAFERLCETVAALNTDTVSVTDL